MQAGILSAEESGKVEAVLMGMTAGELVKEKMLLVAVSDDATVEYTLSVLNQFRILSLPVSAPEGRYLAAGGVDATTADHHQYIGIVSIADVALHLAQAATREEQERYLSAKVASLIGATNESRSLWVTPAEKPLFYAMEPLGKHVHRSLVPRGDGKDKNYTLLTQSDVLRFLVDRKDDLQCIFAKTLQEVLRTTEERMRAERDQHVVSVEKSATAAAGYRKLRDAGVNAAPIIDEGGKLVGTLSFSDLRSIDRETLLKLQSNVWEFVMELKEPDHFANLSSVTCRLSDTVEACAQQMLDRRVHRLWVCDADKAVIGVFSLTDAIGLFGPGSALLKRKAEGMAGGAGDGSGSKRQKVAE